MHESVFRSALDDWWTDHAMAAEGFPQELHPVHHVKMDHDLMTDPHLMTPPMLETRQMHHSTDRDWNHWNWMERSREVFEDAVSEMKHQLSEGVHLVDRRNYLR